MNPDEKFGGISRVSSAGAIGDMVAEVDNKGPRANES
ncbi:hypothetical protein CCACVL1_24768 [Corchorus capsularis]|uniref:Uncharacterized protein n=1 Tax=Corchorus capsularis TaxID=210143 RepID=A0A1R3GN84_COCAP|nr:hypothetical protein CCACVL1_24768 [Corchorus capsularis]